MHKKMSDILLYAVVQLETLYIAAKIQIYLWAMKKLFAAIAAAST